MMKRHLWLAIVSMVAVLALSTGAFAAPLSSGTLTFNGASPYASVDNNFALAGLYNVTYNGTAKQVICDDYTAEIYNGNSWTVNEYKLSDITNFKFYNEFTGGGRNFQFTNGANSYSVTNAATAYMMASWLALKIFQDPKNTTGNWSALNWAIWQIFDAGNAGGPGTLTSTQTQALVNQFLEDAYNAVVGGGLTLDSAIFSGIRIYAPSPFTAGQEFIGVVPEPATMILLGTGLLGVGFGRKKLSKARG